MRPEHFELGRIVLRVAVGVEDQLLAWRRESRCAARRRSRGSAVVDDPHFRVGPRQLVGDLGRRVGAAVVDDDDLEVVGELARRPARGDHQTGDRAAVVVGGKENAEANRPRRGAWIHRRRSHANTDRTAANRRSSARLYARSNRSAARAQPKSRITWRGPAAPRPRRQSGRSMSAAIALGQRRADRAPATSSPVTPSSIDCGDAAGRRGDDRRAGGERLEHDVRQAVDVAGVVADRRHGDDVGGRERAGRPRSCDRLPRSVTRAGAAAAARARARRRRSPSPAISEVHARVRRREQARGVDQYSNALLADQPAGREDDAARRRVQLARARRAAIAGLGREPVGVDAVGTVSSRSGSRRARSARRRRSSLQARSPHDARSKTRRAAAPREGDDVPRRTRPIRAG